jgi:hypothetical protein
VHPPCSDRNAAPEAQVAGCDDAQRMPKHQIFACLLLQKNFRLTPANHNLVDKIYQTAIKILA